MQAKGGYSYVVAPNPILKWIRAHVIERTLQRLPKTDKVLDFCCGYGFYFMINPKAKGIDGDSPAVDHLRSQGFDVRLADVTKPLPFPNGSFDVVIAHDVLEHFAYPELEGIVVQIHRVLRPGGSFWVFVPNRKGYDSGLRREVGHKLYVTRQEIESLSRDLFTIRRHYPEPLPRWIGRFFTHNKEVFELIRPQADQLTD